MRNFSRSKVHFPDLEVCCDYVYVFPLKLGDLSGAGTRDKPLRTSAWEAISRAVRCPKIAIAVPKF